MSIKPNFEAVPTPADNLRKAIATRDGFAVEVETIRSKTAIFAPIEAEVAAAEAELQMVLQADARAMQEWATAGANGAPPEPQHKVREAAATKVSAARAKLNATGIAKAGFTDEISKANANYSQAQAVVKLAEREVLGQEVIRRAQAMKRAAIDYLNTETCFHRARNAAAVAGGCDGYFAQAHEITQPLNLEQEAALGADTQAKYESHLAALLRGENPTS